MLDGLGLSPRKRPERHVLSAAVPVAQPEKCLFRNSFIRAKIKQPPLLPNKSEIFKTISNGVTVE